MHSHVACPSSDLLVQVFELASRKLELSYLRQHCIPSTPINIRDKALEAVDGIEGDLALVLDRIERFG